MKLNDYLQLSYKERGYSLTKSVEEFAQRVIEAGCTSLTTRDAALAEFLGVMAGYMITANNASEFPAIVSTMIGLAYRLGMIGVDSVVSSVDGTASSVNNTDLGEFSSFINGLEI